VDDPFDVRGSLRHGGGVADVAEEELLTVGELLAPVLVVEDEDAVAARDEFLADPRGDEAGCPR
jgi:hypothetical protein